MTGEQAIIRLRRISNSLSKYCDVNDCIRGDCAKCFDALDMAIKALEQEPCEDCISRERLRESLKKELVIVNNNEMYWQGWHDCTVAVETRITDAPSVVPKRGKWILGKEISREYIGDVCVGIEYDGWQCSSCKTKVEKPYKPNWNYCPNCGAKMEVEE